MISHPCHANRSAHRVGRVGASASGTAGSGKAATRRELVGMVALPRRHAASTCSYEYIVAPQREKACHVRVRRTQALTLASCTDENRICSSFTPREFLRPVVVTTHVHG